MKTIAITSLRIADPAVKLWVRAARRFNVVFFVAIFAGSAFAEVDIQVRDESPDDDFLTWAPSPARIRRRPETVSQSLIVTLRNAEIQNGGQLVFGSTATSTRPIDAATNATLTLALPAAGGWTNFYVAGKFNFPSYGKKDATIQAVGAGPHTEELGRLQVMVRVRKNADTLTVYERDIFLKALNTFRQQTNLTTQTFALFHSIHTGAGNLQAHGQNAFLPWHRAFLLHLERRLQQIDPYVSLPYWRFDKPAVNVFSQNFMGAASTTDPRLFKSLRAISTFLTTDGSGRSAICWQCRSGPGSTSNVFRGVIANNRAKIGRTRTPWMGS